MMYFKMAWRNLWRSRTRTLLSVGSIIAAYYFSSMLISLQIGMHEQYLENILSSSVGHLQVMDTAYWDERDLNLAIIDDLGQDLPQGVQAISPRIEGGMLASSDSISRGALILALDPSVEDSLTKMSSKIIEGDYIQANGNGVVINKQLSDQLNLGIGDSIILFGYGYHMASAVGLYPISGISSIMLKNQGVVLLPLALAQDLFDMNGLCTNYLIYVEDFDHPEVNKADIAKLLPSDRVEVKTWRELIPELVKQIEFENNSNKVIGGILFVIVAFGIFGTILMMTQERLREFGILLAIGLNKKALSFVLMLESVLLTGLGLVIGFGITYPILLFLHNNPIPLPKEMGEAYEKFGVEAFFSFSIAPSIFIEQFLFVFIISLLISIYPIVKVSNLNIVKSIND